MKKEKLKVLMELRPCFEGFAGIPQETRLVFHSLKALDNLDVTGLINHGVRQLKPGLSSNIFGRKPKAYKAYFRLSRLAISVKVDPLEGMLGKLCRYAEKHLEKHMLRTQALMGGSVKLYDFDSLEFGDFTWQTLFAKTLPASDYEMIRTALYASIRPSADLLNAIAIQRMQNLIKLPLPRIDTRGYDIFMSQTPWPARVAPKTQLVVRYHDAIPVFLPHTISSAVLHQATHMASLHVSRQKAIFVCTSKATQSDLLKIYPEVEKRSVVVPDTVSHQYFEEKATPRYVQSIIRSHVCPATEPKFLTSREKERFYERHLESKPVRFLMMVSTVEPRKNHSKLIAAWEYLRNHGMEDLKLVLVGELGWEYTSIIETIIPPQEKGQLFHLHKIPSGQLRILYRAAAAVICPSVAEGFDLSGIEAMLCGGAVVASHIPVHREVYGNACEYFDPYSIMDLVDALKKIVTPEFSARREELVERGLRHASKYRTENIRPIWNEFFERFRMGEFKKDNRITLQIPHSLNSISPALNGKSMLNGNEAKSHLPLSQEAFPEEEKIA